MKTVIGTGLDKIQELIEFYIKHYGCTKEEAIKEIKRDLKLVAEY